MTLAGSGRGGPASCSVVPYSSCLPSSCSASPRRWMSRTWTVEGRVSRRCCLLPYPWTSKAPNPMGPFLILTADFQSVTIWEVKPNKSWIMGGFFYIFIKAQNVLVFFLTHFHFSHSVIPRVTRHLLSNPVFTCITLAACMEIAVVAGFAAFLGKYLEQQFNLTTSSANQLLGRQAGFHHGR